MNHEKIHIEQEKELGLIGFLIIYIFNSLWIMITKWDLNKAYMANLFEIESYVYEKDFEYLSRRKRWMIFRKDDKIKEYRKQIFDKPTKIVDRVMCIVLITVICIFIAGAICAIIFKN